MLARRSSYKREANSILALLQKEKEKEKKKSAEKQILLNKETLP
jgi:hypothetical protein